MVVLVEDPDELGVLRPWSRPSLQPLGARIADLDHRDAGAILQRRLGPQAQVIGARIHPAQPASLAREKRSETAEQPKAPQAYQSARPHHLLRLFPTCTYFCVTGRPPCGPAAGPGGERSSRSG
jgi:hypothetical protein